MGNHLDLPVSATYNEQHTQISGDKNSQLTYRSTLGGSAFLRTFRYQHAEYGLVVVKVRLSLVARMSTSRQGGRKQLSTHQ